MVEENTPENPELSAQRGSPPGDFAGNVGKILPVPVTAEMEKAYLDYAMSVIVARALPDVRDGLKPVQRRIIYAMHEQGMSPTSKFSKCAAVVGEVMKKFHPHGDISIYDALVRMAQEFSMRYQLVDGQGNFGSIDGDSAAAMRYTECRLAPVTDELLKDIEKETVLFTQNYDATTFEPAVLPAAVPNLLLNGSSGIAVGMATNIPPHNLGELMDALGAMLESAKVSGEVDGHQATYSLNVEDLMKFVPGPDFPTAALVYCQDEIATGYATGKGSIVIRAKTEITEEGGKTKIIATELPYQVNKATLLTQIAQLVKEGKVKGIGGLRDESDREGIRVVVDLKKEARPQAVLNYLFKHTDLQTVFHMNMVALVDGQPQTLTLKAILEEFLKHRYDVVLKRIRFLLIQAKAREHILQGLKIALDHLDEVIATIKKSADTDDARANLVKKFGLTEIQAQAILDMPLKRLSALEREKIEQELQDILEEIKRLDLIISKPENIYREVKKELQEIKETYGDERRSRIFKKRIGEFSEEELVPEENVIVTITESGYIKRVGAETYKRQGRGGKGVIGMKTKEEDVIWQALPTSTHDEILFFTNKGRVYKQKTYEIPEGSRQAKGAAVVNVLDLEPEEKVVVMLPISKKGEQPMHLFLATDHGTVKKTALTEFENIRRTGIMAIRLKPQENLIWVKPTSGENDVVLVTKMGQSIRFKEKDVRSMGRAAAGVRGIKLGKGDQVISAEVVTNPKDYLLTISERGVGKRTPLAEYKTQGRSGSGILTHRVTAKTGKLVSARIVEEVQKNDLLLMSGKAQVIRLPIKQVPVLGRATQGVYLMRLNEGDSVSAVVFLETEEEETGKKTNGEN